MHAFDENFIYSKFNHHPYQKKESNKEMKSCDWANSYNPNCMHGLEKCCVAISSFFPNAGLFTIGNYLLFLPCQRTTPASSELTWGHHFHFHCNPNTNDWHLCVDLDPFHSFHFLFHLLALCYHQQNTTQTHYFISTRFLICLAYHRQSAHIALHDQTSNNSRKVCWLIAVIRG